MPRKSLFCPVSPVQMVAKVLVGDVPRLTWKTGRFYLGVSIFPSFCSCKLIWIVLSLIFVLICHWKIACLKEKRFFFLFTVLYFEKHCWSARIFLDRVMLIASVKTVYRHKAIPFELDEWLTCDTIFGCTFDESIQNRQYLWLLLRTTS